MDSTHIAISTLLSKMEELDRQKKEFETEKKELERQIREAASQILDLKAAIELLKNRSHSSYQSTSQVARRDSPQKEPAKIESSDGRSSYPFKGSIRDKLLFALQQKQQFLQSRDIAEYIVENEPDEDVEKTIELLSKQVARYKRNGVIVSIPGETGRTPFYGLPQWLNENNSPKEEHVPSFSRMKTKKRKEERELFNE